MTESFPPVESPLVMHVALQYSGVKADLQMAAWTAQKARIAVEILNVLDVIVTDFSEDISLFDGTRTKEKLLLLREALGAGNGACESSKPATGSTGLASTKVGSTAPSDFSRTLEPVTVQASSQTQLRRPAEPRPASATVSSSNYQMNLQSLRLSRLRPVSAQQPRQLPPTREQPVSQPRQIAQSATSRGHALQLPQGRMSNATSSVSRGQPAARYAGRLPFFTQSEGELPLVSHISGELPPLNTNVAASGQSSSGRAQKPMPLSRQTVQPFVQAGSAPAQSTYSHRHPCPGKSMVASHANHVIDSLRKSNPAVQRQANFYAACMPRSEDELLAMPEDWQPPKGRDETFEEEPTSSQSYDSNESVYGGSVIGRFSSRPVQRLGSVPEVPST